MENNNEQPKYLTHDDLNGALASQKKEFQKLIQQMQTQNEALVETLKSTLGPKEEPKAPASRQELSEDTVELKRQIKLLMDRDKSRDETEKRMKLENSLRDAVHKHGIKSRDDVAIKYLKDDVSYDEDGQLVMKVDGIAYPLAEAISKFAQTDQGKFLIDPREVRGSGSGNITNQSKQSATVTGQITGNGGAPIFNDAKSLYEFATAGFSKNQLKY